MIDMDADIVKVSLPEHQTFIQAAPAGSARRLLCPKGLLSHQAYSLGSVSHADHHLHQKNAVINSRAELRVLCACLRAGNAHDNSHVLLQ